MRQKYWVDWEDSAFPAIRDEGDAAGYEMLMTFAEAKKKIIEHFQSHIDHARTMIKQTRAMRVADVESGEQ